MIPACAAGGYPLLNAASRLTALLRLTPLIPSNPGHPHKLVEVAGVEPASEKSVLLRQSAKLVAAPRGIRTPISGFSPVPYRLEDRDHKTCYGSALPIKLAWPRPDDGFEPPSLRFWARDQTALLAEARWDLNPRPPKLFLFGRSTRTTSLGIWRMPGLENSFSRGRAPAVLFPEGIGTTGRARRAESLIAGPARPA